MRNRKRQKKYLAVLSQMRKEDGIRVRHADPYCQVGAPVLPTHPIIPVCSPATPEEQALVVRRLWGGVEPNNPGNNWRAFPAQTTETDRDKAERMCADIAKYEAEVAPRVASGKTVRAAGNL